jgi:hypothetical protein
MNKLINPRIQLRLIAAMGAAILLANSAPSLAQAPQAKRSPPITVPTRPPIAAGEKTQTIDLRSRMKQMKLKEGPNLVYTGDGFKLTAEVKGGKVARWTATDNNGRPLPTKPVQVAYEGVIKCEVCVTIQTGGGGSTKTCTVVDCKILSGESSKMQ